MRLPGLPDFDRCTAALAAALLVFALAHAAQPAAAEDPTPTVRLIVDYGDGASKTINNLAWAKGNTVLDAMKAATARPHGISFSYTGFEAAAILTRIDDVQNEGGGAGRKNWQYSVNNAYGDRSFATFELQAQDVVIWRFATEQGK
jgi:opacity protein-like surface antigen